MAEHEVFEAPDGESGIRLKRRFPRWEYRVVRGGTPHDRLDLHNLERDLNELGAEGWELVKIDRAVDPQFFDGIFKRPT